MAAASSPALSRERDLNSLSYLTVVVVLATVTMTFGALITVFIVRSYDTHFWGHIKVPPILWATTAILLCSSWTVAKAREYLKRNQQHTSHRWFNGSLALAIAFLAGQSAAWYQVLHSGVPLAYNPHSWFIFLFLALHGLHILLGIAGLACLSLRTRVTVSGPKYQMNTRVIANGLSVFWHYLDFLWIVLFALLIAWRR